MSEPTLTEDERRLRDALRAVEETLPLRLRREDLARRWDDRRRSRFVRRLQLVAGMAVVAVVVGGAAWSIAPHGRPQVVSGPVASGHVIFDPVAGGVVAFTPSPVVGPGISEGRATLSLTAPQSASSSFGVGCEWSVRGHVVGLVIGKQAVGADYPFIRWSLAIGPRYEIELVEPDQTSFIGIGANFVSHAAGDGGSGSIAFTDLVLNSGDPTTAPRRSGTFSWTCDPATSLGVPAPSLPAPTADEHGVPTLWLIQNGVPARSVAPGCPVQLTTMAGSALESCATSNWWESLATSGAMSVRPGDTLAFALEGWTVTSAQAVAARPTTSPPGSSGNPLQDLQATLGNGAVAFSPPGTGTWYIHFKIEAAMDDGSTLSAEYSYSIAAS